MLCRTERDCLFRHAEDHTTGFVLGDRRRSGIAHFEQTLRAVVSHSRQNDSKRISTHGIRHRAEQNIHTRAVARNQGPIRYVHHITRLLLMHQRMAITRGDQRLAVEDTITVRRFFDCDLAVAIQAVRERPRKPLRHVLDNDYTWTFFRHGLEKFPNGFGAACGRSGGDDPLPRTAAVGLERKDCISGAARCKVHVREGKESRFRGTPDSVDQRDSRFLEKTSNTELGFID